RNVTGVQTCALPISNIASTPATNATTSIGNPACVNTTDNAINPAPGTPAVPTEANVPVTIIPKIVAKPKSKSIMFAANTTEAPNRIAAPSIFTVAPNGKLKLATSSLIPAFLADFNDSGNVPKLLVVINAVVIASFVSLKN